MNKKDIIELIDNKLELITILKQYTKKTLLADGIDIANEKIENKKDGVFKYASEKNSLSEIRNAIKEKFNDAINEYNQLDNKTVNDNVIISEQDYTEEKNKKTNFRSQSAATEVLKRNVYDTGILDNMFVIYYFLSYGIIGIFIYKLLKQ